MELNFLTYFILLPPMSSHITNYLTVLKLTKNDDQISIPETVCFKNYYKKLKLF